MSEIEQAAVMTHGIRRTLAASVIPACGGCRAPGSYVSHESVRAGWPGCYVEPDDERLGQRVGDECPNCGASRVGTERPLGVIYERDL